MSANTALTQPVWLIRLSALLIAQFLSAGSSPIRGLLVGNLIVLSCIVPLASFWLRAVTKNVAEPYLDEVFHIPQAQVYCQGRYLEWDDKITTPPGLYISTIFFNGLRGRSCSIYDLRSFNLAVVLCISFVVLLCRARMTQAPKITGRLIVTGINIGLFPVLFFFSGLYYTDPSSTLVVLLAYANHLTRVGTERPPFSNDIYTLALGILALAFRQTNIFWVVVYIGGLEVVHAIKTLNPKPVETPSFQNVSEQIKFYVWRYSLGDIHDPSLSLAQPIDIIICIASIGIAAVCNLPTVLRRFLWPHGVVLAAFAAFVAWNGGVVLGDKSNHIATLHLAQLLYIWPFFAFFSAPLFIPHILNIVITVYQKSTSLVRQQPSAAPPKRASSIHSVIAALVGCGALVVALLIVRFNTIIHPFTLADNRHYVFYVFRYSILRAWWIRYALSPAYVVCAWLCLVALRGSEVSQGRWIRSPFTTAPSETPPSIPSKGSKGTNISRTEADSESPATSTMLIFLLTTTLSLMTAPLVEPRYFILPWIFWRLLLPATPIPSLSTPSQTSAVGSDTNQSKQSKDGSSRGGNYLPILLLETAWFVLVNAATMYVFVTRPFYWRAPDGSLQDEGRVQRFMW